MQTIPMHISEGSTRIRLTPEQLRVVGAVSPTVDATRVDDGVEITVHDLRGTTTVELHDGDRGPQGIQGPKGDKGDTGPQGPQGIQGPKGDKGDTGDTGLQGPQGIQGLKGDKGDTGPQGIQGIQGPKGDKGDTGNAFYIVKTYTSISEMNADYSGSDVEIGEFVLIASNVEDPDNAKVFVKGDQQYNFIVDLSGSEGIKGPKGDKGDKGDTGETGPQGEKGETGLQGPQGIQGPKGDTGETGPQGAQGIQGEKGDKGDTGATGPQGPKGDTGDDYVLTEQDKDDIATLAAEEVEVPVQDVQVNGTSILDAQGVANVPIASNSIFGVTKGNLNQGIGVDSVSKNLYIAQASEGQAKEGTNPYKPITPANQHASAFYGLAKAAGDSTQSASSNPVGTYTDDAKTAIQQMLDVPSTDDIPEVPVQDVQVNGTSILNNGVANVPIASGSKLGLVKTAGTGIFVNSTGEMSIVKATSAQIKAATANFPPIVPNNQHESAFYALAKAAGDTTQSASSNTVGNYTESAKSAISQMLGAPVTVPGSTPSITALPGIRYVCGEVATLDITLPASGIVDVVFESGSTATVLTITPPTGVTVKWANGFDPTALEANTTYEVNIMDGLGVVGTWT